MKCIYPDMISSITADENDSNYPVANLSDAHPKKVWKATSKDAVLTVTVASGGALALIATNATSASVTIADPVSGWEAGITWETGIVWAPAYYSDATMVSTLSGSDDGAAWFEFPVVRENYFTAVITLACHPSATLQCGVVRCGTRRDYKDPKYGIAERLIDYSIVKELNNGATYFRKRDIVRTFVFDLLEDRDDDVYEFLVTVSKEMGPTPIVWRIRSAAEDERWIVFARQSSMPSTKHSDKIYSMIAIELIEVL